VGDHDGLYYLCSTLVRDTLEGGGHGSRLLYLGLPQARSYAEEAAPGKTNSGEHVRFAGKVAIVSGGTGGLGRSVSLALLEEGARVIVTFRQQVEFEQLKNMAGPGRSLEGYSVDVTNPAEVSRLLDQVVGESSRVDALVNTVGAYAGGVALWDLDPDLFDRMLALNLRSGYILARAVVPVMLRKKSGAIVDVVAKAAVDHAAGASAYAASKAGALAMMDSLAAELKGTGVRVNSILPSIIDTEVNRRAMPNADFTKWPKPEEIAKVILFLLSDDAKVIHGAALPVYGDS
jgi:NAD(P)-dependent dehydrogenase (short-subunit alcohol dehydrogenase family)